MAKTAAHGWRRKKTERARHVSVKFRSLLVLPQFTVAWGPVWPGKRSEWAANWAPPSPLVGDPKFPTELEFGGPFSRKPQLVKRNTNYNIQYSNFARCPPSRRPVVPHRPEIREVVFELRPPSKRSKIAIYAVIWISP